MVCWIRINIKQIINIACVCDWFSFPFWLFLLDLCMHHLEFISVYYLHVYCLFRPIFNMLFHLSCNCCVSYRSTRYNFTQHISFLLVGFRFYYFRLIMFSSKKSGVITWQSSTRSLFWSSVTVTGCKTVVSSLSSMFISVSLLSSLGLQTSDGVNKSLLMKSR